MLPVLPSTAGAERIPDADGMDGNDVEDFSTTFAVSSFGILKCWLDREDDFDKPLEEVES